MPEAKLKVELLAYTPDPIELCAQSAGICYDKEKKENPGEFIKRIIKTGHESVIEHACFTFRVEGVSRALTHQLVRHRIASYSQRSQRYVKETESSYIKPNFSYLSDEHEGNGLFKYVPRAEAEKLFTESMDRAWEYYRMLLKLGVKPEDARFVLPNACETKIIITMNTRELRHFFTLRMSKHAQWEIRAMAKSMYDLVMIVAGPLFEDLKEIRGE